MLNRRHILFVVLSFALTIPALSQVTSQEQDARLQAATQLARVMNPPETYEQSHKQFLAAMKSVMQGFATQAGVPPASPNFKKRMDNDAEELWPPYDAYIRMFAQAYAAHFTADELTDIMRFYASQTGFKVVQVMPQIQIELMQKVMADAMPKLLEQLRKQTPPQ